MLPRQIYYFYTLLNSVFNILHLFSQQKLVKHLCFCVVFAWYSSLVKTARAFWLYFSKFWERIIHWQKTWKICPQNCTSWYLDGTRLKDKGGYFSNVAIIKWLYILKFCLSGSNFGILYFSIKFHVIINIKCVGIKLILRQSSLLFLSFPLSRNPILCVFICDLGFRHGLPSSIHFIHVAKVLSVWLIWVPFPNISSISALKVVSSSLLVHQLWSVPACCRCSDARSSLTWTLRTFSGLSF